MTSKGVHIVQLKLEIDSISHLVLEVTSMDVCVGLNVSLGTIQVSLEVQDVVLFREKLI